MCSSAMIVCLGEQVKYLFNLKTISEKIANSQKLDQAHTRCESSYREWVFVLFRIFFEFKMSIINHFAQTVRSEPNLNGTRSNTLKQY